MVPFPPLLYHCPPWDSRYPPQLKFLFLDESMMSLLTLMYCITASLFFPRTGACECVHYLMQSPFESNHRKISLPSAAKGVWRFSKHAAAVISTSLSMIRSCGSTPWLDTASLSPPPPLGLSSIPCQSDFRRPSSFCASISTHTGIEVNHSPLFTFF